MLARRKAGEGGGKSFYFFLSVCYQGALCFVSYQLGFFVKLDDNYPYLNVKLFLTCMLSLNVSLKQVSESI